MSEPNNPLSAIPSNSLLGMSFTPDDSNPESPTEVPIPDDIPEIIRATWELDSQVPPLEGRNAGRVYTLHKLDEVVAMTKEELDSETREYMQEVMENNPNGLVAFPFELPDDGDDFLQQLPRMVWTDEIEGVAVIYETDAMLTTKELEEAPHEPEAQQAYLDNLKAGREKSRFVVAATRTEAWSVVHPRFETDPEHIEQGPALVVDLLHLITRGLDGVTPEMPTESES